MCQEHQKAWALNLNGFDVEEAKILRLSGKPQKVPEGKTRSSWFFEGEVPTSPGLRGDDCLLFPPKTEGRENVYLAFQARGRGSCQLSQHLDSTLLPQVTRTD